MSKKKPHTTHAKNRCMQRYGLHLGYNKAKYFVNEIQKNRAKFVKRSSISRTVWDIVYQGITYRLVYSAKTKNIIRVLPTEKMEC